MEHAILHETIDGQRVDFYPETGFDDVMQTDGEDEVTLRMVLEGMDAAIALLQNGLATKANAADVYTKANVYNKTEADNRYLKLSGGTLTNRLTVNRTNDSANGAGLLFDGNAQNFAISIKNASFTKGTAPSSNRYWGIDFYGKDNESYNQRIGMIETSVNANNVVETSIRAYNATSNTNTANCSISCYVDGEGNRYTSTITPATSDNSTKIATTAYVKSNLANYLPLSGGTISSNFNIVDNIPTMYLKANGVRSDIYFQDNTTNTNYACIRGEKDGALQIGRKADGGANWYNGPSLGLTKDGQFTLTASAASGGITLRGKPDGTLSWNGTSISLNGHTHDYLGLNGGVMTNKITFAQQTAICRDKNVSNIILCGGTDGTNGARITLNGKDTQSNPGTFLITANDGTTVIDLKGQADGTLAWNGKQVAVSDTFNSGYTTVNTSTDVSVPSGSVTNMLSVTLTKGLWLIDCVASFAANANGYRIIGLGTSATNQNEDRHKIVRLPAANGNYTNIKLTTFINVTTTSKTVYFNALQNSGSALNVSGGYNLIKLI